MTNQIIIPNHLISHSEVEAFGQCEQKHYYAHTEQLEPVTSSRALATGNAGHFTLETFLQALINGADNEEASKHALQEISDHDDFDFDIIMKARELTKPWMEQIWPKLGWKVLAVEKEFRLTIEEGLIYPFKVDAIIERRGEMMIVDHKFVADPYNDTTIRLMPQMPRYIGAMRMMDLPVTGGIYNFVRTRQLKNPMAPMADAGRYGQVDNIPTKARIRHSLLEQIQEMRKIDSLEKMPANERPIPVRTVNKMNCDHCGFAELCAMDLEGRDTTFMKKVGFRPNTYGYKDLPTGDDVKSISLVDTKAITE